MVETNHHHGHDHGHNHQHPPPQMVAPPPAFSAGPSYGASIGAGAIHPPNEQLHQLHFCIHSNPPWPEAVVLAFQHYIVSLGTSVLIATLLVPQMGGSPGDTARVIQTLTFMTGINTLLQTWFGSRLPTVMGSSFAFIIPVMSVINDFSDGVFSSDHQRFLHTMRAIQGSLIVSSFINIVIGYSQLWGHYTSYFIQQLAAATSCLLIGNYTAKFPRGFSFYPKSSDSSHAGLLNLKRDNQNSLLHLQVKRLVKPKSFSQLELSPSSFTNHQQLSISLPSIVSFFKSKTKAPPAKKQAPKPKVEDGIFGTSGGIGFTKQNELFVGHVAMIGFAGQKLMMMGTADEIVKAPEKGRVFMEDLPEEEQVAAVGRTAGLFNLGNTCYMNSTVQCLHSVPELKSALIKYPGRSNELDQTSHLLTCATRDLFNELDKSVKPVAITHKQRP